MRRWLLIAGLVLVPVVIIWAVAVVTLPAHMVGAHQRSVTRELAEWETEYGTIRSHHDAVRTAEMLGYVQRYYVPSDGYRSTQEIESALETQRQQTVATFISAMQDYSGENFGTNSDIWLEHLSVAEAERDSFPTQ